MCFHVHVYVRHVCAVCLPCAHHMLVMCLPMCVPCVCHVRAMCVKINGIVGNMEKMVSHHDEQWVSFEELVGWQSYNFPYSCCLE